MIKKISLFALSISMLAFLQSCSKNSCYECTKAAGGVTTIQNFCDGNTKAKLTINGIADSVSMGGLTAALYSEGLIQAGYSCK